MVNLEIDCISLNLGDMYVKSVTIRNVKCC